MGTHRPKILAIDDNLDNLTVLKAAVNHALLEVELLTAQSGAQGIGLALVEEPDVILLDIVMPEMDGYEVCRQLKEDQLLREIPVVFITALTADSANRVKALKVGAEGFLTKPLDEAELIAQINAMVKVRAANRQLLLEKEQVELDREKLLAAIKQVGEAIVVTDPSGRIEYANPAFEAVSGYKNYEIIGQNPRIFKSDQQDVEFYRTLWKTISSGRSWKGRLANKDKQGVLYVEDVTISPVFDSAGQIVNYVAVKRNITDQIKAAKDREHLEEQLREMQKIESIGRLAGGIAHDFNNMLGVIMGYGEVVYRKLKADDPLRADVGEIIKAGERSAALTRQLLAFSRTQKLLPKTVDLNALLDDFQKLLRRLLRENIELDIRLPKTPVLVKVDPTQVEQVLVNLITNARDSIGAKNGMIRVEIDEAPLDAGGLAKFPAEAGKFFGKLTITDSGHGIPPELQGKIFDPFFTTKEQGRGTGLGLSTVYGIVKQSEGYIFFESSPDSGTRFFVYLPLGGRESLSAPLNNKSQKAIFSGQTILVVDDERSVLKIVSQTLQEGGCKVMTAENAREAVELWSNNADNIDLLLTDVGMAHMSGIELAKVLLQRKKDLSILFMSGYGDFHTNKIDKTMKELPFLQKPFSSNELLEKVHNVLSGQKWE